MKATSESKRRCTFCHVEKVTKEHVFPEWIAKLLKETLQIEDWAASRPGGITWKKPDLDVAVKRVCKKCNETWMAGIEDEAIPILTPLILADETPIHFSTADQTTVARWAYKTALMASFVEKGMRHSAYSDFFKTQMPPPHSAIIIAAHSGTPFLMLAPRQGTFLLKWRHLGRSGELKGDFNVITLSIYRLVFQVILYDGDALPFMSIPRIEGTSVLWPIRDPVSWPPEMKALSDNALNEFATLTNWTGEPFRFRT